MSSQTNAVCIRRASLGDAAAIAQIHVQSWVETYSDLLSAAFMDNIMTLEDRTTFWSRALKGTSSNSVTFIASDPDRKATGFISCGPQRVDQFSHYEGEIYAIYVLEKSQHIGLGRALMERAALFIQKNNMTSFSCVVLGRNLQACVFYEALGGTVIGELVDERPTGPLFETVYGWDDLSKLHPRFSAPVRFSNQGEKDET